MKYISDLIHRFSTLKAIEESLDVLIKIIIYTIEQGNKIILIGNGGSASDCDHITSELIKSFNIKRSIPKDEINKLKKIDSNYVDDIIKNIQGSLPVISLTDNSSVITSILNDISSDFIFAQQVQGIGKKGDILFCLSTSGNSKDLTYAAIIAKAKGLKVFSLLGKDGGELKSYSDKAIIVPGKETFKIQELQESIYHTICSEIEDYFWGKNCKQ